MFRRRGENLHSIFIFLFLNVAFFFLEYQDGPRFGMLFGFDRASVQAGQWWRVLTYQFAQTGGGWLFFPKPVMLFFTLLILYLMGTAIEEEWGTANFVTLFLISTLATAGVAALLNVSLLGSFFVNYTLLFVYATVFPEQTFYLFAFIPIRVRWLAYISAGVLAWGALFSGSGNPNIAVAAGALAGYVYFLLHRRPAVRFVTPKEQAEAAPSEGKEKSPDFTAVRNAARFVGIKKALAAGNDKDIDHVLAQSERDIVRGVNICPPADFKPENTDGYCIRCEGFPECSARYIKLHRPAASAAAPAAPELPVTSS
ncbi:MAG TPA: rhomboid family intramembrane serine protease [Thermoanaerobaculia bacterium]|jgi:membrane associated rhomboid family serine protease|nr:rhomboid family intramembrane serine protease [Thermoanaerobaculia bacterium]